MEEAESPAVYSIILQATELQSWRRIQSDMHVIDTGKEKKDILTLRTTKLSLSFSATAVTSHLASYATTSRASFPYTRTCILRRVH